MAFRGSAAIAAGLVTAKVLRGPRYVRVFPDTYVRRGEEADRGRTLVAKVRRLNPRAERTGRGSLAGRLRLTGDWDTPSVNDAIARDFGLTPQ